jgi:signal transduction histidine kinase
MSPISGAWTRRGIQTRVVLLVGIGILAALATLGIASWIGLNGLVSRLASERQLLAMSVARHLDYVLQGDLEILQGVASAPRAELPDGDVLPDPAALRAAYLRAHLIERAFVVGRRQLVVLEEPLAPGAGPAAAPTRDEVAEAFRTGRPMVSGQLTGQGDPRLYLLVPMRDWRGHVVALAGGSVDPASQRFSQILERFRLAAGVTAELVDAGGVILASTQPSRRFTRSERWSDLKSKLAARQPAVEIGVGRGPSTVSVLAPLSSAPWAVLIREDEAETFGQLRALRRTLLWLGPALLALALVFAWGAARSVRRPLAVLTAAAERIAGGNLEAPIPRLAEDEVGRLGRSLERMRVALKGSLETIARSNQELEQRVEARTQELKRLYGRLQEREQWREELLRKVISAQEDERRRLARELHDETSQTLSALAMKLETALAAWPTNESRDRLNEAKSLTVRTLEELHRLIFDLRPSVLDDLGLLSAIRWYAERHLERRGITVHFEVSGSEMRMSPELETALFRVAQETITNIAKHASADTVLIQILERDDGIAIEIEDDGEGFDPASLPPPAARERGLGLLGMRERVELFGGTIEIESAPGRGTRIAIAVPLHQEVLHAQDSRPHRG